MKHALLWDLEGTNSCSHTTPESLIACTPTADRYVTFAAWGQTRARRSRSAHAMLGLKPQVITSSHHLIITSHHITSHHITSHHHHTAEPLHQVIITSPHRPIAHTARALRHICLPTPISASTRIPPLFLSLCHLFDCRVVVVVVVVVDVCWVR